MGTRCLTVFIDPEDQKEIVVLYRQYDGYPDGHGKELADFLKQFSVCNGIPGGFVNPKPDVVESLVASGLPERKQDPKYKDIKFANGMPCLAAQCIAHFKKDEVGGFYLYPGGTRDAGEEYTYIVSVIPPSDPNDRSKGYSPGGTINLRCESVGYAVLFDGPVKEFDAEKVTEKESQE